MPHARDCKQNVTRSKEYITLMTAYRLPWSQKQSFTFVQYDALPQVPLLSDKKAVGNLAHGKNLSSIFLCHHLERVSSSHCISDEECFMYNSSYLLVANC